MSVLFFFVNFSIEHQNRFDISCLVKLLFKKFFYLFAFRERGREGEREAEEQQCERDALISFLSLTCCLSHTPSWVGTGPQPRHLP